MRAHLFSSGFAAACAGVLLPLLGGAGCKGGSSGSSSGEGGVEDLTIVVEADTSRIMQEEQNLQQRRDSFEKDRERLAREQREIEQKLASLSKKDRRQREDLETQQRRLAEEDRRVRERAGTFENARQKLEEDKSKLLERITRMTATQGGLTIEQREQVLAQREKQLAEREKTLAEREAGVAGREAEASRRIEDVTRALADLQASGGLTKTVVVSAPASGGGAPPATRATAEKARRQARARMDAKGLLLDDLPPAAKTVWQNGNKALEDKDFASAIQAFDEVERAADGVYVNGDFVKAKMGRINRDGAKKGDEAVQKQINSLLAEVSDAMTEGRYDRANRKINQIVNLLADK